ncbi:hypothetical protein CDAR_116391 [Caerostris darwini]|uniref:Uncharacterized protein n=1 Tax=Caerostris darwini TaxID=1538125 RepID=A0AAV4WL43_9ARAC|nr:hypothetical protein CDAR_116391 [Caerostris darwini]
MNTFRIPPHKLPNDRRACIPLSLPPFPTPSRAERSTCAQKPSISEREREIVEDIDLAINDRTPRFHIGIKNAFVGSRHFRTFPPPHPSSLLFIYRLIRSRISILGEKF